MRKEEYTMSEEELLQRLSDEYQQALVEGDNMRIENEIAPRFWERFGRYYTSYGAEWMNPHPTTEVTRHMDDANMGEVQMEWMVQVLRGEIELGDEMDEEDR